MRSKAYLLWLLLITMGTLLFFGSSTARMGLLGNCDFAISQERLSAGKVPVLLRLARSTWLDYLSRDPHFLPSGHAAFLAVYAIGSGPDE